MSKDLYKDKDLTEEKRQQRLVEARQKFRKPFATDTPVKRVTGDSTRLKEIKALVEAQKPPSVVTEFARSFKR